MIDGRILFVVVDCKILFHVVELEVGLEAGRERQNGDT